ncbi:major facilitator superfamily domain-containing protein [Sporodiniella umbellata]|nr:major facilitator superfamily domain-containing protein [Sporodiniella umbellata]
MVDHFSEELEPLVSSNRDQWRWWITFAPCLYIFIQYYFEKVSPYSTNAINLLSSIYMLVYPFAVQFTFKYFEDPLPTSRGSGLRRGILIGAVLNAIAGCIRWMGAIPNTFGFFVLFFGQTVAALAQVFMLAIPPQLAVAWFPKDEINMATSIAVSANNLGIGVGCALTPLMVHQSTSDKDIPNLLLFQVLHDIAKVSTNCMLKFIMCLFVLLLIWAAFEKPPPYWRHMMIGMNSSEQSLKLWNQKEFIYMLGAYGIIMGGQCAIITLLAQILLPPFQPRIGEKHVGILGACMLFGGSFASIWVGYYLDKTLKYRKSCTLLALFSATTCLGLSVSIVLESLIGVVVTSIGFGLASYAIAPAIFQFASELFYPISEIIPTGYLFTGGNVGGVVLVALMGWTESREIKFSMQWPMACLTLAMFASVYMMYKVKGTLKRTAQPNVHNPL